MQNKTVIITGAGFSAPANIPIQNKILDEMIRQETNILDASDNSIELDNEKFLDAFVRVGLYLLTNYCNISKDEVDTVFQSVTNEALSIKYTSAQQHQLKVSVFDDLRRRNLSSESDDRNKKLISNFLKDNGPFFDEYFTDMIYLKGQIKRRLEYSEIKVSLEDIFTAFDKATSLKTHTRNFTYHEEDDVKQSILRLFIYYFGKILNGHSYDTKDYLSFVEFVKDNKESAAIITTNWDTLTEGYFLRNAINYDLCLNSKYYKFDDENQNQSIKTKTSPVKLIKLHGSINWFRCLQCGCMSIIEKSPCGEYLLSTGKDEMCINCGSRAKNNSILLQPEIITPTMIKSFENQLYKNLWTSGAEELRNASKIIFIGYSMPTADFELKYFLQNNILPSTEIDVVLHHNDNPKQLTKKQGHLAALLPEKRYSDAFKQNKTAFFYDGFKSYFIDLNSHL